MAVENVDEIKSETTEVPAAKKTAAKKTAAKKKTAKTTDLTKLAESVLLGGKGPWGTGRERDDLLKAAGHDVEAVRREVQRIRSERLVNP